MNENENKRNTGFILKGDLLSYRAEKSNRRASLGNSRKSNHLVSPLFSSPTPSSAPPPPPPLPIFMVRGMVTRVNNTVQHI